MTDLEALLEARKRWGRAAAIRNEDPTIQRTVFRGRFRVGTVKGSGVDATLWFIERGAGDSWETAFDDATLQERPQSQLLGL